MRGEKRESGRAGADVVDQGRKNGYVQTAPLSPTHPLFFFFKHLEKKKMQIIVNKVKCFPVEQSRSTFRLDESLEK